MRGRLGALLLLAATLALAWGAAARADVVVVQVKLNGAATGQVVRCERPRAGDLALSAGDLRRLGLALGPERGGDAATVALATLPGVDFDLDEAAQVLSLSVPPALLARRVITVADDDAPPPPQPWGALVDYAVSATAGEASPGASATLEARVFGPVGVFEASALVGAGDGVFVHGARRLDVAWILDDPAHLRRLTVGDFVTAAPAWTEPVRAAGGVALHRLHHAAGLRVPARPARGGSERPALGGGPLRGRGAAALDACGRRRLLAVAGAGGGRRGQRLAGGQGRAGARERAELLVLRLQPAAGAGPGRLRPAGRGPAPRRLWRGRRLHRRLRLGPGPPRG